MISLCPMTQQEYDAFLQISYDSFADDLTAAQPMMTREAALKEAQSEVAELLPEGLQTKNHYLFAIRDEKNMQVGYLWYDLLSPGKAFVDDLLIFAPYRRKGYALQALKLLEEQLTVPHITLHVFEGNRAARALYEKAGFAYLKVERAQSGSLYMFKRIR